MLTEAGAATAAAAVAKNKTKMPQRQDYDNVSAPPSELNKKPILPTPRELANVDRGTVAVVNTVCVVVGGLASGTCVYFCTWGLFVYVLRHNTRFLALQRYV